MKKAKQDSEASLCSISIISSARHRLWNHPCFGSVMCYSGPCCGEATESTGVGQDDVGSHGLNQSVASLISKVTFRSRGEEDKDTREAVAKAPARGKAEPRSLG